MGRNINAVMSVSGNSNMRFVDLKIGQDFVFIHEYNWPYDAWPVYGSFIKTSENTYSNVRIDPQGKYLAEGESEDACLIFIDNRKKKNKIPRIKGFCHPEIDVYSIRELRHGLQN